MNGLTATDLHKTLGNHPVLNGLNLTVPAGSLTAILGPSGSGKTTLLRLVAGFERPDEGTIAIADKIVDSDTSHVRPEHRRIGYVPQEGSLFPHLTIAANVGFGLPRGVRTRRVGELLELVGLAELARRYPHQLSGGQQQRVALARALAVEPEIVLLDEPFASLDAHQRTSVREEVQAILRRSSTTTLLVTHDQDEALSLGDLVAVLRDGKIVQCTTPEALYTSPVDDTLARFVGDANLLHGILDGALVDTTLGRLPVTHNNETQSAPRQVTVLIRPEQIELSANDGQEGLRGQIVRSNYHGHDAIHHIRTIDPRGAPQLLVVRTLGQAHMSPGTQVMLTARGPVLVWPAGGE